MPYSALAMSAPGLLVLRCALAAVFVAHGAHKLFGVWGGAGVGPGGLDATAGVYAAAGLQPAFAFAVAGALVQFVGGILLATGMLTRWTTFVLLLYVLIGVWFVHLEWGFFLDWTGQAGGQGIEYSVVLAGALISLMLMGPGDVSVDGHRASTSEARASARARVRNKF